MGDTIHLSDTDLTITCAFSEGAFPDDAVVICPQALFDESRKVVHVAPGEKFTTVAMLQLYVKQEASAVTDAKTPPH